METTIGGKLSGVHLVFGIHIGLLIGGDDGTLSCWDISSLLASRSGSREGDVFFVFELYSCVVISISVFPTWICGLVHTEWTSESCLGSC